MAERTSNAIGVMLGGDGPRGASHATLEFVALKKDCRYRLEQDRDVVPERPIRHIPHVELPSCVKDGTRVV